mmetsp:Transcript_15422/g.43138  ORF Transcript_15422/g.43138 Transcript_15422/m.43138 type:complete len:237 (-) Transcript_15422:5046-5756(-)
MLVRLHRRLPTIWDRVPDHRGDPRADRGVSNSRRSHGRLQVHGRPAGCATNRVHQRSPIRLCADTFRATAAAEAVAGCGAGHALQGRGAAARGLRLPLGDHVHDGQHVDRLCNVVIHSAGQALLPVAHHGIGRHSDDRSTLEVVLLLPGTDVPCRFPTILYWHVAVHEHHIHWVCLDGCDSLGSIDRRDDVGVGLGQQPGHEEHGGVVVLRQQTGQRPVGLQGGGLRMVAAAAVGL